MIDDYFLFTAGRRGYCHGHTRMWLRALAFSVWSTVWREFSLRVSVLKADGLILPDTPYLV
jgi:hypothetical protein